MLLDKTCRIRRSEKYKNEESLGAIWRVIDWGKYDESWSIFFRTMARLVLEQGEQYFFN